jgi:hypothetical protein
MTHPHLPLACLVEERLILRRQRRVLLLQGPYAFRVSEGNGLKFRRRFHGGEYAGATMKVKVETGSPVWQEACP